MHENEPAFCPQTSLVFGGRGRGEGSTTKFFSVVSGSVPEKKLFLSNPTEEARPPCFKPKIK